MRCGFCGRENDEQSRFCIDCGKPIVAGGARIISVASLAKPLEALEGGGGRSSASPRPPVTARPGSGSKGIPDTRVSDTARRSPGGKQCPGCGGAVDAALPFCPHCGVRVSGTAPAAGQSGTAAFTARGTGTGPKLSLLDAEGTVVRTLILDQGEATFGRVDGDYRFADDVYLSPVHAQIAMREGQLYVRDLGSRNSTWVFIDSPYRLQDGDTILVGSQIIRFRRLGYPGPHPPEADQTRRLGSFTPSADVAVLAQLRADGSARDTYHLSPGRNIKIGRDMGDWVFPYDQTMSGTHAEIRNEDLEFIVLDDGSRNGVAIAVRGEKAVKAGQRILMGDQTLRVESV